MILSHCASLAGLSNMVPQHQPQGSWQLEQLSAFDSRVYLLLLIGLFSQVGNKKGLTINGSYMIILGINKCHVKYYLNLGVKRGKGIGE